MCSQIFQQSFLSTLGSDAQCSWPSQSRMVVKLGNGPTVVPGTPVTFAPSFVLIQAGLPATAPGKPLNTNLTLPVQPSSQVPVVNVVLKGPTYLGNCDSLRMDSLSSTGQAGRGWLSAGWFIDRAKSSVENYDAVRSQKLFNALDTVLANYRSLTISVPTDQWLSEFLLPSTLPPGEYAIALNLTNWVGTWAVSSHLVKRVNAILPMVIAPQVVTATNNGPIILDALVASSSCSGISANSKFTHSWYLANSTQPSRFNTIPMKTASRLVIPPGVLNIDTEYKIVFSVTQLNSQGVMVTEQAFAFVYVTVRSSRPLVRLLMNEVEGSGLGQVDPSVPLVLNASTSSNPDNAPMFFAWGCEQSVLGSAFSPCTYPAPECSLVNVSRVSNGEDTWGYENICVSHAIERSLTATTPALSFQPFELGVAQQSEVTYRFTVTVSTRSRSAVASATFRVVANLRSPNVFVKLKSEVPGFSVVPTYARLRLEGNPLPNHNRGLISRTWSLVSGPTNPMADPNLLVVNSVTSLVFAPSALLPDSVYTFRFFVTDTAGQSSYAEVVVATKPPPAQAGSLSVIPSFGFAMSTQFIINAGYWEPNDISLLPLSFTFWQVRSPVVLLPNDTYVEDCRVVNTIQQCNRTTTKVAANVTTILSGHESFTVTTLTTTTTVFTSRTNMQTGLQLSNSTWTTSREDVTQTQDMFVPVVEHGLSPVITNVFLTSGNRYNNDKTTILVAVTDAIGAESRATGSVRVSSLFQPTTPASSAAYFNTQKEQANEEASSWQHETAMRRLAQLGASLATDTSSENIALRGQIRDSILATATSIWTNRYHTTMAVDQTSSVLLSLNAITSPPQSASFLSASAALVLKLATALAAFPPDAEIQENSEGVLSVLSSLLVARSSSTAAAAAAPAPSRRLLSHAPPRARGEEMSGGDAWLLSAATAAAAAAEDEESAAAAAAAPSEGRRRRRLLSVADDAAFVALLQKAIALLSSASVRRFVPGETPLVLRGSGLVVKTYVDSPQGFTSKTLLLSDGALPSITLRSAALLNVVSVADKVEIQTVYYQKNPFLWATPLPTLSPVAGISFRYFGGAAFSLTGLTGVNRLTAQFPVTGSADATYYNPVTGFNKTEGCGAWDPTSQTWTADCTLLANTAGVGTCICTKSTAFAVKEVYRDCTGVPNGGVKFDKCLVCGGADNTCVGCDGLPGFQTYDRCGVCNGKDDTCTGCDGFIASGLEWDTCGVCNGQNRLCSYHGVCSSYTNTSFTCKCSGNFGLADCSGCLPGWFGADCNRVCNRNSTCSGHGECSGDGVCSCDANYSGARCETCAAHYFWPSSASVVTTSYSYFNTTTNTTATGYTTTTVYTPDPRGCYVYCHDVAKCSGHGACDPNGACKCDANYGGLDCSQCAVGHFGANCEDYCVDSITCTGHGVCHPQTHRCICDESHTGLYCHQCAPNWMGPDCGTFCLFNVTCFNGGECNITNGDCVCPVHMTGPLCQDCETDWYFSGDGRCMAYCNRNISCSGHGECTDYGACVCVPNWTGFDCSECLQNYYGNACELYCNRYSSCSGHGSCVGGYCMCEGNYYGDTCSQCKPNTYTRDCSRYCEASTTCSSRGKCSVVTGLCECDIHWVGDNCNLCETHWYSDCSVYCLAETNCNGHGICNSVGGCNCLPRFVGDACDQCEPNYYGPDCDTYCLTSQCPFLRECDAVNGTCVCQKNFAEPTCQTCKRGWYNIDCDIFCLPEITCSGHGTCTPAGECICSHSRLGADCSLCPTSYYGWACDVFCDNSTCASPRVCRADLDGACDCPLHFTGPSCAQCAANYFGPACSIFCEPTTTCNSHGACVAEIQLAVTSPPMSTTTVYGSCRCDTSDATGHWGGLRCEVCAAEYYPSGACNIYCSPETTCGSRGACLSDGSCFCYPSYTGLHCELCVEGQYGPDCFFYCDAASTCASHGQCGQNDGKCICETRFTGPSCNLCAPDYYGKSCERYCSAKFTCSGHGTCQPTTGVCVCESSFSGASCGVCAPNYWNDYSQCDAFCSPLSCNGHGTCTTVGSCKCDARWGGARCEKCAETYFATFDNCRVVCTPKTTCSGHGSCHPQLGVCVCDENWEGDRCDRCESLRGGANCENWCSTEIKCLSHGSCEVNTGACVCAPQYAGQYCELCGVNLYTPSCDVYCNPNTTCYDSQCSSKGECICRGVRFGKNCEFCPQSLYGYNCDIFCQANITCSGSGVCNDRGLCECKQNYFGTNCQNFCVTEETCSGHGLCNRDGYCDCSHYFEGNKCDRCVHHQYGEHCHRRCYAEETCNDRGTCSSDGFCICTLLYTGERCDKCKDTDYFGPLCDVYCNSEVTCTGHGRCVTIGRCSCDVDYFGVDCSERRTPLARETLNIESSVGGEVIATTGDGVEVPKGSFSGAVDFSVQVYKRGLIVAPSSEKLRLVGSIKDFRPEGIQFTTPVVLILSYLDAVDNGETFDEDLLRVYHYDEDVLDWSRVGGSVDKASQTVRASVTHFSKYMVVEEKLESRPGPVRAGTPSPPPSNALALGLGLGLGLPLALLAAVAIICVMKRRRRPDDFQGVAVDSQAGTPPGELVEEDDGADGSDSDSDRRSPRALVLEDGQGHGKNKAVPAIK